MNSNFGIEVEAASVRKLVRLLRHATGAEGEGRDPIACIHLEGDATTQTIKGTSTNGRVLRQEVIKSKVEADFDFVLPPIMFSRIEDYGYLYFKEVDLGQATTLTDDKDELIMQIITPTDTDYPLVSQFTSIEPNIIFDIDPSKLKEFCYNAKRASRMVESPQPVKDQYIRCYTIEPNSITFSANVVDDDGDRMPCNVCLKVPCGEDQPTPRDTIGLNRTYFEELLKKTKKADRITMGLSGPLDPVVFYKNEVFMAIIMPVRLT